VYFVAQRNERIGYAYAVSEYRRQRLNHAGYLIHVVIKSLTAYAVESVIQEMGVYLALQSVQGGLLLRKLPGVVLLEIVAQIIYQNVQRLPVGIFKRGAGIHAAKHIHSNVVLRKTGRNDVVMKHHAKDY